MPPREVLNSRTPIKAPRHWRLGATRRHLATLPSFALTAFFAAASTGTEPVRIATFNVSLYGQNQGEVLARLQTGNDRQTRHIAEIIQRVRPDVLLLNEIDYDPQGEVLRTFHDKYLAVAQNASNSTDGPAKPIEFPHRFTAPVNTGRHSGFDLDKTGKVAAQHGSDAYAGDCWGYGRYEGQYAMAILSQHPIDEAAVRTFRNFRWKDMPNAKLPDDPTTSAPADWYPAAAMEKLPLSSKSHWDVPVIINGKRLHLLASHPTPPVFDGPEDRNGRRNHDEIRFWVDYVSGQWAVGSGQSSDADVNVPAPSLFAGRGATEHGRPEVTRAQGGSPRAATGEGGDAGTRINTPPLTPPRQGEGNRRSPYIYDDAGHIAHLAPSESFIILGDLNGDPHDGDGPDGIKLLLASPRLLNYPPPESDGAAEQARLQGGANARHRGDPRHDTCDPADDPGPGNLRIDYVLPSADLKVAATGVFWPITDDPLFPLVGVHPFPASDHRMVWLDLEF